MVNQLSLLRGDIMVGKTYKILSKDRSTKQKDWGALHVLSKNHYDLKQK